MKIVLIGSNGQLGTDILKVWEPSQIIPLTHREIEITDFLQAREVIKRYKPEIIINTAAYHNVPECEKNPEKAFAVNAVGVRNLVSICREYGIKLVHISTDYVFDGKKSQPYTENDTPNPLNVYAISKLAGEFFAKRLPNHYIIRVAGLFGIAGCRGKGGTNFVENMLALARTRSVIEVTANIVCSPTYTYDAAMKIKEIITNNYSPGIYHLTNSGQCSWYEFAKEIFRQSALEVEVIPKEEREEEAGVCRPMYSALISQKLKPLRSWQEALSAYLTERTKKFQELQHKI